MCFLFRKLKRITPLASLSVIFFLLAACSQFQLDYDNSTSVAFRFNPSRSIFSEEKELYLIVELKGDYEAAQEVYIEEDKPFDVISEKVPIEAEVYVTAQVYTFYEKEKLLIYSGESEKKTIEAGENEFSVKLANIYNSIASVENTCLIRKPLFYEFRSKTRLSKNLLNFDADNTSFYWTYDKIRNYQKAIITLKKTSKQDRENRLKINLLDTETATSIELNTYEFTKEEMTVEFFLPVDRTFDAICIENVSSEFSCRVEKIELQTIGSFELVDITLPENPSITVNVKINDEITSVSGPVSVRSDKTIKFEAEEGFTSYKWRVNTEEVQSGSSSEFSFDITNILSNVLYDITLFADSDTRHESWNLQVKKIDY